MTLYRAPSGARVFGSGTVQWPWGLDANHDRGSAAADVRMQQATLNLLADMGAQPGTLQPELTPATASTDASAPSSAITSPAPNATVQPGSQVTITGTAGDTGGGVVGGVEVSTDNGQTWRRADGRARGRTGGRQRPPGPRRCAAAPSTTAATSRAPGRASRWRSGRRRKRVRAASGGRAPRPIRPTANDNNPVTLGVKFRALTAGRIAGVRFYKGTTNTGTHVAHLWTRTGTLLASATFTGETASGWQEVRFASPVDITANTTYIASYHAPRGNYAFNLDGFQAAGVDNPPLRALRDGEDGGNGLYAYGPSGTFPNATYRSENYWVDVVFETGADTTGPTVTAVTPGRGATGIAASANVTARFSEPVDPTTVSASTITLRNPSGTLVPAAVSYDAGTQTATLDPAQALADNTIYTALVRAGPTGVKDFTGNAMSSDDSWTFTTRAPTQSGCPCSIWAPSARPLKEAETGDTDPIEVGVKFRADTAGRIAGVRFYKGTTNTGTHIAHLWTRGGTLLASATFTGESASGWQEVLFAAPVEIAAGTTYVASYHAPRGNYASNVDGFQAAGVDNPPLRALRDDEDGGNGVYGYGPSGTFPNGTWRSENYWVDVVFDTDSGPDTTAPTVTGRLPAPDAQGVAPASNVSVSFSEAMATASITTATFQLRDPGGNIVPAAVSYDGGNRTATLDPQGVLADSTRYTATVKGGTGGVTDTAGNELAADASWGFTTAAPPGPGPDDGPGGSVLVIAKSTNPFSRYYAEILRAEGVNAFAVRDIANVTSSMLAGYDVAIVGDFALTTGQVTMLSEWVTGGGDLIAMRPDKQLAGLLGLADAGATLADAYMRVDASRQPGAGIVSQTMQFHGTADRYVLNGATSVADLYSNASTATTAPAVTMRSVGVNGGRAAAFTYDLARSVVYTRQGNPAWAGQERDGTAPIRANDMFFGPAAFDPRPNWVDLGKVAIPQADEQQRLLVNLIGELTADKKPLPRFWYLPRGLKAAVIMTGDEHADGGAPRRFDQYVAASPAGCSVAQWECIRATAYLYPSSPTTPAQAANYAAQGFEIGLHVNTDCGDSTRDELDDFFASQLVDFHDEFPGLTGPFTNRIHCIAYSDWATTPKVELDHGIRLDGNYYYWPPQWVQNVPGMFTGSGMPMRFADLDGSMIDVYQSTTQMTDESGQTYPFTINTLLDRALGATGYYGAFNANMHTDDVVHPGSDGIVASAKARGVPVVSAQQMLTWLDGRNGSKFSDVQYAGDVLSFSVAVGAGATGLRGMVPASFGGRAVQAMTRDGAPLSFTREVIKGVDYAFFAATAGNYTATYAADTTAPAISAVNAVAAADGTATVTWTTDEPSDSLVEYGTSAALGQNASDGVAVTAHRVVLNGLVPGATYRYRVHSADGSDNVTTAPAPPAPPATFGVPVTRSPAATGIETGGGTLRGGNAAALSADDDVYYRVNSTTGGTRTSSWYGSFTGVPAGLSGLKVTYTGRNSRDCMQVISAWRWADSTWQQLNSSTVGNADTTRADLVPPGAPSGYVSPTGELRVRVRCTTTASFFSSGDLLRISYTP